MNDNLQTGRDLTLPTAACSETADERYARWDREAAETKAAALANPDTWIAHGDVAEDAGSIGGDVQAGPAWSKRFDRWMPSIGKWAVINDSYYVAAEDRVVGTEDAGEFEVAESHEWVQRQLEILICRDPSDPGGTEEWSDYTYETPEDPTRTDYDAYARELAGDSRAEDYPDPLTHRDAAVWAS